ncbi:MAG: hypothetical protein AVDCRST_MAG29-2515, partial [uncultured Nocardioidaceae bacterium]
AAQAPARPRHPRLPRPRHPRPVLRRGAGVGVRGRCRGRLHSPPATGGRDLSGQPGRAYDAGLPAHRRLGGADLAGWRPPTADAPRPVSSRHRRCRAGSSRCRRPGPRASAIQRRRFSGLSRPGRAPLLSHPWL